MSEQDDGGMDLRDALRGVDPREFVPLLDAVRESPEKMKAFITYLAQENPIVFMRFAKYVLGGKHGINWPKIDGMLRAGDYIPAIKEAREETGMGLKETKQMIDERREQLGLRPPPTV